MERNPYETAVVRPSSRTELRWRCWRDITLYLYHSLHSLARRFFHDYAAAAAAKERKEETDIQTNPEGQDHCPVHIV